jgi:hypothetical protein
VATAPPKTNVRAIIPTHFRPRGFFSILDRGAACRLSDRSQRIAVRNFSVMSLVPNRKSKIENHLMTRSARYSIVGGIVKPICRAALILTLSSSSVILTPVIINGILLWKTY